MRDDVLYDEAGAPAIGIFFCQSQIEIDVAVLGGVVAAGSVTRIAAVNAGGVIVQIDLHYFWRDAQPPGSIAGAEFMGKREANLRQSAPADLHLGLESVGTGTGGVEVC